jgi:O-antigen ligase
MLKIYKNITRQLTILFVLLSAFSINLPTRFLDLSLGLLLIFWVISGDFKNKIQRIRENPGALAALGFFIFIGLGVLYSSAPLDRAITSGWLRYVGLLSIPIIVSVLKEKKYREYAINAFLASSILLVLLSYFKWLGFIPLEFSIPASAPSYFIVFKLRIAHTIFAAYAIYLMFIKMINEETLKKYLWGPIIPLYIFNIFYLVDARSGQITFFALLAFLIYQNYKNIFLKKYLLTLLLISVPLFSLIGPNNSLRLFEIKSEIQIAEIKKENTSSGERMEFWKNTVTLIKRHPLLGAGTGSQQTEYDTIPDDKKVLLKNGSNPHNHYLLILQEMGILGLIALLTFFLAYWKLASHLTPSSYREKLQALIFLVAIASLFNCMLWAGEGKFFCVLAGVLLSSYSSKIKQPFNK